MDIVQFPDPSEGNMLYGYIIILIVFVASAFTLHRIKKASKKQIEMEKKEQTMYEMVDNQKNINE